MGGVSLLRMVIWWCGVDTFRLAPSPTALRVMLGEIPETWLERREEAIFHIAVISGGYKLSEHF